MLCRLARDVQVRKESWGLLFYSSAKHKLRFVRSGDLLYPYYFDGAWTLERLVDDVARRKVNSVNAINPSIQRLVKNLVDSELIVNEPC
jgi:putative mycofactocin binding protein MftB